MTNYIEKIKHNNIDYPIGGDNFDSQWVANTFDIMSGVTLSGGSNYVYELSSYLPDDDYDYEVVFSGSSNSTATKGKICQLMLGSGTISSGEFGGWRLNRCQARTAASVVAGASAIVPIFANDRYVTVRTQDSDSNNTSTYFSARGYRRLGNNKGINLLSNINSYKLGGKFADGSTVIFTTDQSSLVNSGSTEHNLLVGDSTLIASTGSATHPLNNILPNDGYDYEICLSFFTKVSTSGKYINVYAKAGSENSNAITVKITERRARTNADYNSFTTVWLPIKASDKNIYVYNAGDGGATYNIQVHGYRRLGTNSYDSNGSYGTNIIKNINGYKIAGNNFDGQWVISDGTLASNVTYAKTSATTYSLASYLPDDGYDYMVAFSGWGRTPSGSGGCTLLLMSGTQTYNSVYYYGCRWQITEYHSESSYTCSGNLMIPIFANDRNITLINRASSATGNCGLYAVGYRRLGTNE